MELIADIFLAAGALGAAVYCVVLAGRLKRFNNLQNGVGGAVAVLSAQVDDMTKTLEKAQTAALSSAETLTSLTERAEGVSRHMELMLASMHDLPETIQNKPGTSPQPPKEPAANMPPSPEFSHEPVAQEPAIQEPAPQKAAAQEPVPGTFFSSNRAQTLEAAE